MDTPRGYDAVKALARATGRNIPDLLGISRNSDPFASGSPGDRALAEWFAGVWARLGLTGRRNVHLRGVHYLYLSKVELPERRGHDGEPYLNTLAHFENLNTASRHARYLGLVPVDALDDRRNPPPRIFAGQPGVFHEDEPALTDDDPDEWEGWALPEIKVDLSLDLGFDLPTPGVTGYDYELADQPYLLECWVEKSTMNDVLAPVCQRLGINLVISAGYQSITNVRKLLDRAAATGKPARVFYVSDFDPHGDHMPAAVARQIEFWLPELAPGADVRLTPLALTVDQVREHRLPTLPIKDTDAAKGNFEIAYGEGGVELDALEALYPGELARLLREAAEPYFDQGLADALADAAREAEETVEAEWAAAVGEHRADLDAVEADAGEIAERYRAELERLNDQLQAEMAPLQARLDAIRHASEATAMAFRVDLPDRPGPENATGEAGQPDDDDWLYASDRDYFDQLAYYKRRRGDDFEEVTERPDADQTLRPPGWARRAAPPGVLTPVREATLAPFRAAPGGALSSDEFRAAAGISRSAASPRLNDCAEAGFLERVGAAKRGVPQLWCLVETSAPAGEG